MCQAYEGERRAIVASEHVSCIEGFAAAKKGKPRTANPCVLPYDREAWDHGWKCYKEGIIPWAIEKLYREKRGIYVSQGINERFRKNRFLPLTIKSIVSAHA